MTVRAANGPAPGSPAKRAPSPPPAKRPPGAPVKRPPGAPAQRGPPPARRSPSPPPRQPAPAQGATKKPSRSRGRKNWPTLFFALAFLVSLALTVRFILVGVTPLTRTMDEWFPLNAFDIVLVLSFLLWPAISFIGSRKKNNVVVWVGTGGYLLVSLFFTMGIPSPLIQHLVFGGPFMLVGAIWQTSRG